jgi:hypothetical protein
MPIYRSQFDSSVENVIQISEQYLCIECTSIFLYLDMDGYSLVARLLATETLCMGSDPGISKKTKMGDISKGVTNPPKNTQRDLFLFAFPMVCMKSMKSYKQMGTKNRDLEVTPTSMVLIIRKDMSACTSLWPLKHTHRRIYVYSPQYKSS